MILATTGGYEVDDDQSRLDLDVVTGFLHTAYWSAHRSRETVERAVERSMGVGLYAADARMAGFARVVTDATTFAYLADVFVLPEHRGRGLARFVVTAVLEHPDLAGVERWMLATADAHGVYEPLGFAAPEDPTLFMVRQGRPRNDQVTGSPGTT